MPQYMYECDQCGESHTEIHKMTEDPDIICPECNVKCFRAIQPVQGFVKGNCYLDKKGCKKAAELATLTDDDPYKQHRQPGETDDLVSKIKNRDKHKTYHNSC